VSGAGVRSDERAEWTFFNKKIKSNKKWYLPVITVT
jgi:hypothetical protein